MLLASACDSARQRTRKNENAAARPSKTDHLVQPASLSAPAAEPVAGAATPAKTGTATASAADQAPAAGSLAEGSAAPDPPASSTAALAEPDPAVLTDPARNLAFLKELAAQAQAFYQAHPKYTCRITRQEKVGLRLMPRETLLMNFRLEPRSVFYHWLDDQHQGRECVWVEGRNEGKLTTLGGKGDFVLAGRTITIDPDGAVARGKSRYTVSESGMDRTVASLAKNLQAQEQGNLKGGKIRYAGLVRRDDLESAAHHVVQEVPPSSGPLFPKGGTRNWFFDVATARLLLVTATDPANQPLEYYRFDRFIDNDSLSDTDFDPNVLWPNGRERPPENPLDRVADRPGNLPK